MGLWQLVIPGTVAITELTTVCLQMMSNVQCTLWVVIVFKVGKSASSFVASRGEDRSWLVTRPLL